MSAPSIDDKTVRPPATGGTEWTAYEPAFSEGATNSLYFTDCMVFTDGSISYSEVSKSTSYEAAKAAYNKALGADGKINEMQENIYTDGTNTIDGSKITAGSIEKDQILEGSLSIDRMDDTVAGSYSDPVTKHGSMEWKDDALHIKSKDSNEQNTYETVIGGDGMDGGRISKLMLKRDGEIAYNYDRGLDIPPADQETEMALAILMKEYN